MKLLNLIIILVILQSCNMSKQSVISANSPTASEKHKKNISDELQSQNPSLIHYTAGKRGFYLDIVITENSIAVNRNYNTDAKEKTISKTDWQSVISHLDHFNIKELSLLEAPSKAFQYDGAAVTQLKVVNNDVEYSTKAFDHGNPPEKIKALVNAILALSEDVK